MSVWVILLAAVFAVNGIACREEVFAKQASKSSKGKSKQQAEKSATAHDTSIWDITVQHTDLGSSLKVTLAEIGLAGYPLLFRVVSKSPTKNMLSLDFSTIKLKDSTGKYHTALPFSPESLGACHLFSLFQKRIFVFSTAPSSSVMCSNGDVRQQKSYAKATLGTEPTERVASVCESQGGAESFLFSVPAMPVYPAVATLKESKPGIVDMEIEGAKEVVFFLVFEAPESVVPSTLDWAGATFPITEKKYTR